METERPYKRAVERIVYSMPVEVSSPSGSFVMRGKLCDISPLAARVEFIRLPRLHRGDPVTLTLAKALTVDGPRGTFVLEATVLMFREGTQLVLMFADPQKLLQEGFPRWVYGPLLIAAAAARRAAGILVSEEPPKAPEERMRESAQRSRAVESAFDPILRSDQPAPAERRRSVVDRSLLDSRRRRR